MPFGVAVGILGGLILAVTVWVSLLTSYTCKTIRLVGLVLIVAIGRETGREINTVRYKAAWKDIWTDKSKDGYMKISGLG